MENYWRTGRRVGRTIYVQIGYVASDDDALIGMMDTAAIATAAVEAHNRSLAQAISHVPTVLGRNVPTTPPETP